MRTITNLAMRGGGVRGIAYAGAIQVLSDNNMLDGIKRVSGTSAGSANALLLALNYTPAEVLKILSETKFSSFEDNKRNVRILFSYGIYKGQTLFDWTQSLVKNSPLGLTETSTFADLKAKGGRDLYVFACDLNMGTTVEFSADKTPNVALAEAVRASMSIPIFFKAWKFTDDQPNDHVYVDGGVQYVFPISVFDGPRFNASGDTYNEETLGLFLDDTSTPPTDNGLDYGQPGLYVKSLFSSLMAGQTVEFKRSPGDLARTVIIDDLGIPGTDFDLTDEQITNLVNSGKTAMQKYIDNPPTLA